MKALRYITFFGQFGFTFVTPPVVMGLLDRWLQSRFGLGTWIMLICLLLGLMTSFAGAVRFYRRVMLQVGKKAGAEELAKNPVMFYRHD